MNELEKFLADDKKVEKSIMDILVKNNLTKSDNIAELITTLFKKAYEMGWEGWRKMQLEHFAKEYGFKNVEEMENTTNENYRT